MTNNKKIDMTKGPIFRNIFLFALPIILGNILQQLYTTVDTLVIGNFCGNTSLAAVGTSSQPVEVLLCVFLGVGGGVSILTSQYVGAGDTARIKATCETAVFFIFMVGVPLGILGVIATPAILAFMGVPADTMAPATAYTRIVFLGTLGNLGYNMNAGILRGMGDSRASLRFLVVSCIANIVLDLVFVAGLGMDAAGAALSTTIAMYISWFVSIIYIRSKFEEVDFPAVPRGFSGEVLRKILSIGIPMGLNNSLYSFGHMAMQTMINAQGSDFMAGVSVAGRITGIANVAITALSQSASTFSGQNYGAKNYDRLRKGYLRIPLVSGAITLLFGMVVIAFRMPLLRFFTKDANVLLYASRFVVVILAAQWMYAVFNAISNTINGVGMIKYSTIINILMLWAIRIPTAYIITKFFDGTYVMVSTSVSFGFGMIAMLSYYAFSSKWKKLINS